MSTDQPQLPAELTDPITALPSDQARQRLDALLGKKVRATVTHGVDGTPRIIEGALTTEIGLYTAEDATVRYPGSTVHVDHRNLLDVEEAQDSGASPHHCVPTQWAYDQACAALDKHRERADKAAAQVEAVRALHDPEIHYHRANLYEWTADCDHCDAPVRDTSGELTSPHFADEHGELRCRIRPRRTCTHCLTNWGEEVLWPCETAELVKETDDAHS